MTKQETQGERLTRHSQSIITLNETQVEILRVLRDHGVLINGDPINGRVGALQLIQDLANTIAERDKEWRDFIHETEKIRESGFARIEELEKLSPLLWIKRNKIATGIILSLILWQFRIPLEDWIIFLGRLLGVLP